MCVTWAGTGVDITLVSTDVEGSTELWEWVSASTMYHMLLLCNADVRHTDLFFVAVHRKAPAALVLRCDAEG